MNIDVLTVSPALSLSVSADQVRQPCVIRHRAFDDFEAVEFPPKSKVLLNPIF
jgi:hypothetical protein